MAVTLSCNVSTRLSSNEDENKRYWPNAGLILGQRRRRWPNIKPALGVRLVFVEKTASLCVIVKSSDRLADRLAG